MNSVDLVFYGKINTEIGVKFGKLRDSLRKSTNPPLEIPAYGPDIKSRVIPLTVDNKETVTIVNT